MFVFLKKTANVFEDKFNWKKTYSGKSEFEISVRTDVLFLLFHRVLHLVSVIKQLFKIKK